MPGSSHRQHDERVARIASQARASAGAVALKKTTSNLFRPRTQGKVARLDVRELNHIIAIDTKKLILDVEGMTTYEEIVNETLKFGLMPPVVPQLKTITIGGGVSGLAIESSSWREGLTHESVIEMDIVTSSGDVATCSKTTRSELFHAIPNSYGTLGYIVRLRVPLRRVKPYVHLRYLRFSSETELFMTIDQLCQAGKYKGVIFDFIDAVIFAHDDMSIVLGTMVDEAPYTSDYTYMQPFYRSIRSRDEDFLTIRDYIWRWDTDWFWCSKNVGAHHPLMRRLLGRRRLGSRTYQKMMRFEDRWGILGMLQRLVGHYQPREAVIQDVQVPIGRAAQFLKFFHRNIGILPIWVCPTRAAGAKWPWTLYPMDAGQLYVNIGFWDSVPTKVGQKDGHYNRLIEKKLQHISGTKSLYSSSYYSRPEFEKLYNYPVYTSIKQQYDPDGRFKDLYEKCVEKR